MSLGMCRRLATGHAISMLNHCLSSIRLLALTYTTPVTPDSGLTYTYMWIADTRNVDARQVDHRAGMFAITAIPVSVHRDHVKTYTGRLNGSYFYSLVKRRYLAYSKRSTTAY